jgi:hypothetical protein
MKRNAKLTIIGSALAFGASLGPFAHAGGICLYETAAPVQAFAPGNCAALQVEGTWRDQWMS